MLRWLLHLLGVDDAPDPAWAPTGYRVTQAGRDEARAAAAVQQSDEIARARREMAARRSAPRSGAAPPPAKAACRHCRHWKRKAAGRGVCWDQVPAVTTREDHTCPSFLDVLANRAEVDAWHRSPPEEGA